MQGLRNFGQRGVFAGSGKQGGRRASRAAAPPSPVEKNCWLTPVPYPCTVRGAGLDRAGSGAGSARPEKNVIGKNPRRGVFSGPENQNCRIFPRSSGRKVRKVRKMAALPGGRFFRRARHVYRAASRPSPPCTGSRRYRSTLVNRKNVYFCVDVRNEKGAVSRERASQRPKSGASRAPSVFSR